MADNPRSGKDSSQTRTRGVEPANLPRKPATTDSAAAWQQYAALLETMLITGEPLEDDPREIAAAIRAR